MKLYIASIFTLIFVLSCSNPLSLADKEELEFNSVYSLLDSLYLYADDELKPIDTYKQNINRMVESLSDPYTDYFDPKAAQALLKEYTTPTTNKLIGIVTGNLFASELPLDTVTITHVYPNSPASKSGLKPLDQILRVSDSLIVGDSAYYHFFNLISGKDKIQLKILRGDSTFKVQITKEELIVPTVFTEIINDSLAAIQITGFREYSYKTPDQPAADGSFGSLAELRDALKQAKKQSNLIIDLRHNPGGSVSQCTAMAGEFLSKGDTIALVDDRGLSYLKRGEYQLFKNEFPGSARSKRIVLMADEYSASCAEIFVMALRANTKFPLVGKTTYGKGIGQSFPYTINGGILKVTSLGIYNKDKVTYHNKGIVPDYPLESIADQNKFALSLALGKVPEVIGRRSKFSQKSIVFQRSEQKLSGPFNEGAYFGPDQ